GFSAYVVAQTLGHPHMSAVFLLPLVALVLVRYVRRELTGWGLAWRLGLALGWQLWISTELYSTLAIALAGSLGVAYLCWREHRPRLRSALGPLAAGYGLSLPLAGPLLYSTLSCFR